MTRSIRVLRMLSPVLAAALVLWHFSASAAEFTYDAKVNKRMARKLNIPVFFALPASARAALPGDIDISDKLVDFKHPDAEGASGDVGLRLVVAKRRGIAKRLADSGLVQTGDILLSFRSEWGGAGPYPNVQMGISHSGVAYVKDGVVHNIDNPMNHEYLGQLDSSHYRELKFIHIIRPRDLDAKDRENITKWATRLVANAKRVYPKKISFNSDYNAPNYQPGKRLTFVKHLAQTALGQNPPGNTGMYCSEFAWSLLALKHCDPDRTARAFARGRSIFRWSGIPRCVKPVMTPMHATDSYVSGHSRWKNAGLAEGPLMVIDAMNLPEAEEKKALHSVFVTNPKGLARLSSGHRKVAKQMQPKFAALEVYYNGVSGSHVTSEAKAISAQFNKEVPDNYSPTSFLINTLLPPNSRYRTMDYVATIAFE